MRDKVVEYVSKRYAYRQDYPVEELKGTVCSINTEGVLAARSAIRQVGKVTGVAYSMCDQVAKLVPATVGMTLKKALEESDKLQQLYHEDDQVKRLIDDAMLVEGTPVQTGVHAAGVIIADKPISEYAPMFWNTKKNTWVIQYDMVSCESDCGLLKMDFLGLRNLDIIMRAKNFIRKTEGGQVDYSNVLRADDTAVIDEIYGKGDTDGVFQFESGGMKQTLQSFVPKSIDDVILLNAAYRPGPMQFIPDVTNVKFGRQKATYIVPEMASILDATYGSPIYQEQIQQIFHEIAGFSLGQADIIRRAMSKKHLDELVAAKGKFVAGFKAKGASDTDIEQFWNGLLEFAKYAFNKSHAAAYSVLSYQTAWLKHYYSVEYMASLMSYTDKEGIGLYIKDAKDYGITVLPPDINKSIVYTAPTKNKEIRYGLEGLMDVGAAAERIVVERKNRGLFKSYKDLLIRCTIAGIDKGAIESLIKSGAIPKDIVDNRQEAVENLVQYMDACRSAMKTALKNDEDLNALMESNRDVAAAKLYELLSADGGVYFPPAIHFKEYDYEEMLKLEKEYTGFYISGHPLDKYEMTLRRYTSRQIAGLENDEKEVVLAGHITEFQNLRRKKDGKAMCKFVLEDLSGSIDTLCFAYHYERLASQLTEGAVVCLKGSLISLSEDEDGEYRFKTKEELYGIAKNDNVLKQGIDTAFTFALFINMMCEKYSKEVKASLRKELFGNVSKNHVSESRNEKMHKELSELRKANNSLLLQRDELQRYRESSLKRENALQAKLEKALDEISQLEQALDEDNINLDDSQAEGPALELSIELGDGSFDLDDEEDYSLRLNGLLGENKVVFVGGNENLMKKFRNRNPNAITIHNKEIAVCDNLIKNADAVFFKVDSMSHGLYEKCKSIAQKANVPVAYIPEITSVKMIEKTAYEMLTSMLVKKEG